MSAYTDEDVRDVATLIRQSHLIQLSASASELVARRALAIVTPAIAARALREAADNPDGRLSGHSGVSVRWLRGRADEIEGKS